MAVRLYRYTINDVLSGQVPGGREPATALFRKNGTPFSDARVGPVQKFARCLNCEASSILRPPLVWASKAT
jgi:hypothetical protein